jgi:transposase
VIVDAQGTPLVVHTTAANVRDDQPVPTLLAKLRCVLSRRPIASLHGDRAYGFPWTIAQVRDSQIEPVLAERRRAGGSGGHTHGSGLGRIRRVVEQTLANFGHCRRLKHCYEKRGEHFQAFHDLAATLLCFNRLCYYRGL